MPPVSIALRVHLPDWLYRPLRRVKHAVLGEPAQPAPINLLGDREVEWSFVAAHMPPGPGEALDFGCGGSYLSLIAARRGFGTTAVDLQPDGFAWQHPSVRFMRGDLFKLPLPREHFDLVLNCSAIEHAGLPGRYRVTQSDDDADLKAMHLLRDLMKPGALMLLTVPCGRDAVFAPLHRVYGARRLPLLLEGYLVAREEFWAKNCENRWLRADRQTALDFPATGGSLDPSRNSYALGCFLLRKAEADG